MEKIIKDIRKFNQDREWEQFHKPDCLAKSISIESGELLECFQWNNDYDKNHVCEELADVLIYCFQMCIALDVNPEEIIKSKMQKNAKKYPLDIVKDSFK